MNAKSEAGGGISLHQVGTQREAVPEDLVQEVVRLVEAEETALLGGPDSSPQMLDQMMRGPDSAPQLSLIARRGPAAIGAVIVEVFPQVRELYFDVHLVPGEPVASAEPMIEAVEAEAARLAEADPGGPATWSAVPVSSPGVDLPRDPLWDPNPRLWQVLAGLYTSERALAGLLSGRGYRFVRRFLRMQIDFPGGRVDEPAAPSGVEIRVAAGEADLRTVYDLYTRSFADHWGEAPRGFEPWMTTMTASVDHDPQGWWIASVDGRPSGVCIMSDSRADRNHGYVDTLGVLSSARGRGVATWLLRRAFAYSAGKGYTGCELDVDSASPTGADRLYRSAGMSTAREIDVFLRPARWPAA